MFGIGAAVVADVLVEAAACFALAASGTWSFDPKSASAVEL